MQKCCYNISFLGTVAHHIFSSISPINSPEDQKILIVSVVVPFAAVLPTLPANNNEWSSRSADQSDRSDWPSAFPNQRTLRWARVAETDWQFQRGTFKTGWVMFYVHRL